MDIYISNCEICKEENRSKQDVALSKRSDPMLPLETFSAKKAQQRQNENIFIRKPSPSAMN